MTSDTEITTPLLDQAGVTSVSDGDVHPMEAFIGQAMPVDVDPELSLVEMADFAEYVDSAEDVIRATYERIGTHLELLRAQREQLNDQIAVLVEKQRIWEPIMRRVEEGIRHRKPKIDGQEELTVTDLGV